MRVFYLFDFFFLSKIKTGVKQFKNVFGNRFANREINYERKFKLISS